MKKQKVWLLVLALCMVFTLPASVFAAPLADVHDKFLGNITKKSIGTDSDFETYWNQVTPENSGKWDNVEETRDNYDWSLLDDDYNFAQSEGFPFKEHTLVWGSSEPDWLSSLSAAEIRAEVEEWIADYFDRYPNTQYVDVVNEPIAAPPSQSVRDALGGDTDWAWVKWIYEKAEQYKPSGAELHVNEYDILKFSGKRATYKDLIEELDNNNLLDGIGMQGHFLEGQSGSSLENILNEMDDFGLPLYISEYDVNQSNDTSQKNIYADQFPVFWEHPAVEGVTLWGYKEGEIWRDDAFLLRSDGSERPALQWLRDYLDPIVDLDFDSTPVGVEPGGWTLTTPSSTKIVADDDPSSSDRSIWMEDNNTSDYPSMVKSISTQSDRVKLELKFKETNSDTKIHLRSGSTIAVDISSRNGGLAYHDGSGDTAISNTGISNNTWYTVKVIADVDSDTFDLYLNDQPKIQGASFRNNVGSIDNLFLAPGTNGGTNDTRVDDIKIYGFD